ncbi:MAG: hypothetical protein HQL31_09755 [Planctomycetes bacterium]|nr:hypothetical protein [Planctomycetota bacterium]
MFFKQLATEDAVTITHTIKTDVHADHYSGGRALAAQLGAPYCLHENNAGRVKFEFQALRDQVITEQR